MARSAESTAREAIRARGSRKLVGRRSSNDTEHPDGEGCVTGHPAFMDVRPAFELGRMPEGGGYPLGFIELAARLMAADLERTVHLCSGSIHGALTFDYRHEAGPACVGDVRRLPVRSGSVRWIMADPPYEADYAEALWGLGKAYPTPMVLLREAERILLPGGRVAFLHHVVPVLPDGLIRVGTWGVTTGPGYRIRALTIAEKDANVALPFDLPPMVETVTEL